MAQSNITKLKAQLDAYFHTTYITKYPSEIHPMLVHLYNDGKRLRPILFIAFNHLEHLEDAPDAPTIATSQDYNKDNSGNGDIGLCSLDNNWLQFAIDIELIHCLSLVMDDLPEMDDELERRGKPCFHVKFGLQTTTFFIYYMFSRLSINLAGMMDYHGHHRGVFNGREHSVNIKLLDDTTYLIQHFLNNLIDGQYIDITHEKTLRRNLEDGIDCNTDIIMKFIMAIYTESCCGHETSASNGTSARQLENYIILNLKKTGTLFALPVITGFLLQLYKKDQAYTGREVILDDQIQETKKTQDAQEAQSSQIKKPFSLGDDNFINLIITWASLLGFLFQTSDDYLDMAADAEQGKPNICNILGTFASKRLLSKCCDTARVMLDYIIQNTHALWPDVVINGACIKEIIAIIEARIG